VVSASAGTSATGWGPPDGASGYRVTVSTSLPRASVRPPTPVSAALSIPLVSWLIRSREGIRQALVSRQPSTEYPKEHTPDSRSSGSLRPQRGQHYGFFAMASSAFCLFQQVGQRHSSLRVPSGSRRRVKRQPNVALISVWSVLVSGAWAAQTTQCGRSATYQPPARTNGGTIPSRQ
jgi:hypothetical protein